ncbi:MAG: trypsin-like serine protease [Pseudomonadota bacterium]
MLPPISTIKETLTDKASLELAHSNRVYDNVGRLWLRSGKRLNGNGSVNYLGGLTCVTAAHCVVDENKKFIMLFDVFFELADGRIDSYEVESVIVHPSYMTNTLCDIAVLKLKKPVSGLNGALLDYSYGKKQEVVSDFPEVTFVGYCKPYSDVEYRCDFDQKKRAAKSFLGFTRYHNNELQGLCAFPHRASIKRSSYIMSFFVDVWRSSRTAMPYELGIKQGMSGGGAFKDDLMIGVNMGHNDEDAWWFDSYIEYWIPRIDSWLDYFRGCCDIPHLRFPEHLHEGRVPMVMPLGAVEEWLEGWRQKFDGELGLVNSAAQPLII